jgi:hypothetical protein
VVNLGDGKTIEKVGAEVRAIVQCYQQALDRCAGLAFTALKLGVAERYADQLERSAELFARVLAEACGCSQSHPAGELHPGDPAGHRRRPEGDRRTALNANRAARRRLA